MTAEKVAYNITVRDMDGKYTYRIYCTDIDSHIAMAKQHCEQIWVEEVPCPFTQALEKVGVGNAR